MGPLPGMAKGQVHGSRLATATVRGGRLRLPAAVLQGLDLKDGGELVFFIKEGRALMAPLAERVVSEPSWD